MLQQTQVPRVVPRYERWLERFPTIDALARAPLAEVLEEWQGLGYNRRAVSLKRTADEDSRALRRAVARRRGRAARAARHRPATAAGILAFAFEQPSVYLETNVRAVFLHELFADAEGVRDREIVPLVAATVADAVAEGVSPREWYYALLDYGAWLKRTVPNPSRRSAHHVRQSPFEGSQRQKRARLLRAVMRAGSAPSRGARRRDRHRARADAPSCFGRSPTRGSSPPRTTCGASPSRRAPLRCGARGTRRAGGTTGRPAACAMPG